MTIAGAPAPLELLFVRHGEGEHMLDLPRSLHLAHPRLTEAGRQQVETLRTVVAVNDRDLVLASPTTRTLETARILCNGASLRQVVSPAVGPRMFPQNPEFRPLVCDDLLPPEALRREFPEFQPHPDESNRELWSGINQIPAPRFAEIAQALFAWCRQADPARVIVVSHDGTIHNYRELLGETDLTRASFLGPAGIHRARYTPANPSR